MNVVLCSCISGLQLCQLLEYWTHQSLSLRRWNFETQLKLDLLAPVSQLAIHCLSPPYMVVELQRPTTRLILSWIYTCCALLKLRKTWLIAQHNTVYKKTKKQSAVSWGGLSSLSVSSPSHGLAPVQEEIKMWRKKVKWNVNDHHFLPAAFYPGPGNDEFDMNLTLRSLCLCPASWLSLSCSPVSALRRPFSLCWFSSSSCTYVSEIIKVS